MIRFRFCVLGVLILSSGLAGCSTLTHRGVNGSPMPVQSFEHIESIPLGVSEVKVVNAAADVVLPDDFVFSFYDHAFSYLSRKFVAGPDVRDSGSLVLRIVRADVSKVYVPHDGGVAGFLDVGGVDRYVMDLTVAVDHVDWQGNVLAGEEVYVQRRLDVSEHVSLSERETAQLRSVEAVFSTLNAELGRVVADLGLSVPEGGR